MCLAVRTDQNGSAHVVLCRPSIDKMQFACLPLWLRCFLCSPSGSVFSFSMDSLIAMHRTRNFECKFGRTEGSRSSVHNELVHAVFFRLSSCWEHACDLVKKKSAIHVEVVRGEFCADSRLLIQRPPVACSIDLFDHGLVAPGGWYPS